MLGLPPRQRAAVFLYYLLDLPIRDVGVLMRCRDGTVKALLAQARSRLARTLDEEARDEG